MAKNYSLDELSLRALSRDVTWDMKRVWGNNTEELTKEQIDRIDNILRTSHISKAVSWIESTSPDKMKYGTATREERLEEATGHAALAGVPLVVIAQIHDIESLLDN